MDFTVLGGQSVTGYVPTYHADVTNDDLKPKATPVAEPVAEAVADDPNLGYMGEDGKSVVYGSSGEGGRVDGEANPVPSAALNDDAATMTAVRGSVEVDPATKKPKATPLMDLMSPADAQMAMEVAMFARGTYGEKQRQLEADFLNDMLNPDITGDPDRLMARCNQLVTDRFCGVHDNGNILNGMKPFTDAKAYADTLASFIRGGWEAIETDEWKAVKEAASNEDYAALMKLFGVSEYKDAEDESAPATVPGAQSITGYVPQYNRTKVLKSDAELREELDEKVFAAASRNFLWMYERMKPDLSDEGAAIVDHAIQRGSFDMNDADAFRRLRRENSEEASKVKFLVDAARPTEEAWFVDTGYETWHQLRDMVTKAGVGIGENMRRYLGLSARHMESQLDRERYERMVAEGVPEDAARKAIEEGRAEREIADMADERTRLEMRRAELDIQDMTDHKSWEGYGWLGRSTKGIFTTLPYIGVNAIPVAGFAMNVFSHMQDMEDRINQEGGDPTNGRILRAFGAVAWAGVEKLEFDGMFGRTLTRMEKKNIWRHLVREGVKKMAVNGWELGKAYGKEWAVKTGYETFQEGVQGAIESVEHDIGFFNHLDPKQRADAHRMLLNAVGAFFEDMKESVGTMAGLSVGGAAVGTARNVKAQYRAGLDRESIDELLRRRNAVDAMIDGTWVNLDVSGTKPEHKRKILDRLTSVWTEAKGREEAMARIRSEFGLNDEQVRQVADLLDLEQMAVESIAKEYGTGQVGEAVARLAGVKHDFVVGNDTVYDPKRLYAAFNANIKVEDVEVEDANAESVAVADSERLAGLRAEKAEAERNVREANVGSARRGAQRELRRINRKIAAEEARKPDPQKPKRMILRVTIPMVKPDGTTVDRNIVINETTGAVNEEKIKDRGFATSVAHEYRKNGLELLGIRITDDTSERAAAEAFYNLAQKDARLALHEAGYANLVDRGNFSVVDEDTGKTLADADGIVNLAVKAAKATDRSGNLTLTHETTHGIVKFAEQLGVFGDTRADDYKPEENDMVVLFRQLFGNPMQKGELFNEEVLSDALAAFMRDEYDFGKFKSEDQRGMAERAFDGVVGILKYAWNQAFKTELVTPRDVNLRREAQLAVFQAIRQGDFRGLSKYAGITFKDSGKAKVAQKAEERAKEQAAKPSKMPARDAWRLRKRQGVQGDATRTDAPMGVPGASGDASAEVERVKAENERLLHELNVALAGGKVTVPARVGGKHVVHSPVTWIPVTCEWVWMPRKDVVPAGAGSNYQERFRSLNEASRAKILHRAQKGVFNPERLTQDNVGDRGAPILAGGNVCISGNGRMLTLEKVSERGGYSEYVDYVRQWCRENGIADCPADMLGKDPVLVQRVVEVESEEKLVEFAKECNRSDHEELSASEAAKADVAAISPTLMRLYDVPASGDIMSKSNWPFIRAFYKAIKTDVPETMDGRIEPEAGLRVQRAFLAKLMGGEASDNEEYQKDVFLLINTLLAGGDGTATVRNALVRNGSELYAMLGNKGSYNVIPELQAAVKTYVAWRAAVQNNPTLSLKDYVNTPDMFRVTSPIQDALTQLIETRYFNAVLKKYNDLVAKQSVDAQAMLDIAGAERLTSGQLLAMAEREVVEKDADGNPVTPYVTKDPSWGGYALQPQSAPAVSAPVAEKPEPKPSKDEERKRAQEKRDREMEDALSKLTPDERAYYDALMAKAETSPTVSEMLAAAEEILRKREDDKPFVPCPAANGTAAVPNALAPGRGELKLVKTAHNGNTTERTWNLGAGVWDYLRIPYFTSKLPKPSKQDEAGRGLWTGKPLPPDAKMLLDKYQGKCPLYMGKKNDMTERVVRTIFETMSKAERAHYTSLVDCFGGGGCWGLTLALTCFPNANRLIVNEFDEGRLEKIRLLQTRDGSFEAEVRKFFAEKVCGEAFDEVIRLATNISYFRKRFMAFVSNLTLTPDEKGMAQAVYDYMAYKMQWGASENIGGKEVFSASLQLEEAIKRVGNDAVAATELAQAYAARGGSITYVCGDAKNQATFGAKVGADGRVSRTNTEGDDFDVPSGDSVVKVCDPPYYRTTGYSYDEKKNIVGFDENPYGWGYKDTEKMLSGIVDSGSAIVYTDEAWFYGKDYTEKKNDADYGQSGLFDLTKSLWRREQDVLCNIVNILDHFDVAGDVAQRFETLGVHHGHSIDSRSEVLADDGGVRVVEERGRADGAVHGRGGVDGVHQGVDGMAAGAAAEDGAVHGRGDSSRGRGGVEESADRAVAKEACVQAIEEAVEKAGETVTPDMDTAIRHSVRLVREERMADYARLVSSNAPRWLRARRRALDRRMDEAGYTERVWHGTEGDDFNVFRFGSGSHGVRASYFTYRRGTAENYAALRSMDAVDLDNAKPNVRQYYVNPGRVLDLDEGKPGHATTFQEFVALVKKAYADGYDSVRVMNAYDDQVFRFNGDETMENMVVPDEAHDVKTDILIVFDRDGNPGANRVKAADAVTFADDGLPIPVEFRSDRSLADVRYSVAMGNRAKEEARAMIAKYRPEFGLWVGVSPSGLDAYEKEYVSTGKPSTDVWGNMLDDFLDFVQEREVAKAIDAIAAFDTPKERKAALYWFCKDAIRLPEDSSKVIEAIKTAERAKVDPFQFERPGEILEKYAEYRPVEPPINPDTVSELSDRRDMGHGIVTYLVQDDQAGQAAMRKIINTHFGKGASPWCLLQGDGNGGLADSAWHYWQHYNALPKRVAFKDGKLCAFMATDERQELSSQTTRRYDELVNAYEAESGKKAHDEFGNYTDDFEAWYDNGHELQQWWDRADAPHDGIPFTCSVPSPSGEGANATEHAELMPDGKLKIFKTTRGDPKAKVGRYEEWFPNGEYKFREDGEGRDHHFELWVEGIEQEHCERHDNLTLEILKYPDGSIIDARVESEEMANPFRMRYGKYHNELVIRKGYDEAFISEGTPISADDFVEIAKGLYDALKRNDNDAVDAIVNRAKSMAASTDPRHSVRSAWRSDFPKAVAHTTRKSIMEKYGELFRKAKAGDKEAAADIIEKVVKPEKVQALVAEHPNASIVVPVYAEEATGRNQLPRQFANYISALTGIEADDEIIQSVRAFHSGSNADHRLFAQPEFYGPVKRGAEYIIVDDHITQGGTVNALRDHIESNGGKVVAVSALTLSQGSSILSPRKDTIDETRRKWPDIDRLLQQGGIADRANALTESQLRYINQFSPDGFRARIAQAVQQGIARVRNETLGTPSEGVAREETQAERAAMRHSVFVGTKAADRIDQQKTLDDALRMIRDEFEYEYTDKAKKEIYRRTGWWMGTDHKWRYEIRDFKTKKCGETIKRPDSDEYLQINGLRHYGDTGTQYCNLTDMVSHTTLFKAYPKLKNIVVDIVAPDEVDFSGQYDPNLNRITLTWDAIQWIDDEPSNVLELEGLETLTHEVQHAVQYIEGFAKGGSKEDNGERNYVRLAGEVEARNASRRIGGFFWDLTNRKNDATNNRSHAVDQGMTPWDTEDVPRKKQIIADEYGSMTDVYGKKISRASVHRGNAMNRADYATALFAARRLAGKDVTSEDADKVLKNLGVTTLTAADALSKADQIAEKLGITISTVNRLGDRAHADLGWTGEISTRRTEFGTRNSVRVVERDVTEDDVRRVFDPNYRNRVVATRSMRRPIDVVTGYAAAQLLGGREVKVEDLDATLKNVGIAGASAPDVLAAAQALADRKRESVKTKVGKADPNLYIELANDNLRQRVGKQIDDAVINGAAIADPEIGVRVERAAQAQARRALDAAKGFTARQMQQELPISLADAVFAEAEYERSPEEQAKLEEQRKKREEEREAEKQAAAEAGMSVEEYREMLQADRDANTVYVEPDPQQKKYFDELMDRAKAAKEKEAAKDAERKAKAKAKAEADGKEDGEEGADDEGGADGEGEDILPIETVKRIAPIFGDADTFAMFIAEWCADNIVKRHPEIPNTAQMWRNPVAVRELIKTAQGILEDLAMDVLGSPEINSARNYADRSIILLAERKTYKGVVKHIAYTYDMIHNQALRLSRRKLVGDLVKAGDKATGAKGRFSATQEMKTRTTFAKTELWWRHLRPFLTMGEEKLTAEIARLQGIVDGYNKESSEDGYDADNFQEYRDACDCLALANRYGGMVRWMPSKIQAAAAEIMQDLNGRRAEFEAMRDERDEDNKRIREAIIRAVVAGGTERYRKEANRLIRMISGIADDYRGQLLLELQNLIRYCKDENARAEALEAIKELDQIISRGSEKHRVTYGQGLKEVHDALADIYGSAIAGAKHLKEKIPEDVALQIFSQQRNYIPTYGQLLQLYASCLQKDYKDNVEKHDRSDQIELMRDALTTQDLALHAWAIEWYAHNRQALSDAVEEITGLSVASPDNLYCPVRVLQEKGGFAVEALAWCPVPSALNRRVKHGLDFNEGADFLNMLEEQCEVRAQLIGYGMAGIRLRDTIAHHDVQAAVAKYVGRGDMKIVTDHVRDVLVQNVLSKNGEKWLKPLNVARKWASYCYLGYNSLSASKQPVSMAMWAVVKNPRDALRYFVTAFTREGRDRIRELIDTDGYRSRYVMGWSEETLNMMINPTKNKWVKYIENFYSFGMKPMMFADKVGSLWMAQGFYGDMKQQQLDLGFNEEEAKERAATFAWAEVERTQQSGRTENFNRIQRSQGGLNAFFQFMSSQILQNAYEIQAWKEVAAGTPGAKGRLARAIFVNHVVIPALLEAIAMFWRGIMGEDMLPDEPEDWPPFLKELAFQMLFSQTAPLFFVSSIVRTTWNKLTGTKSRFGYSSSAPAVEFSVRVAENVGTLVFDAGKFGAQEFTPFDFEEEVTVEKLQDEFLRAADSVFAPARHLHRAVKNRTE